MEQIKPHSPGSTDLRTSADYDLVARLLKYPRYKIPECLRDKVVSEIAAVIDNDENDATLKLKAISTLATLDKHNIDLVKLAMPKKTEQSIDVRKVDDEALLKLVKDIQKLLPPVIDTE